MLDLKPAALSKRKATVRDIDQAGDYHCHYQKTGKANASDSVAHKIEREENAGLFKP
jgi:hypothetical protein